VAEFAPADHCFIDAAGFAGPDELAAYLNWLNEHDDAYQAYLAWKRAGLSARFQALLAPLGTNGLCRLCEHLRRRSRRPLPAARRER
jgi:hypothetical protein